MSGPANRRLRYAWFLMLYLGGLGVTAALAYGLRALYGLVM